MRAILVDDEENAREVLENLLRRFCPQVELLASCELLTQAVDVIQQEKPQLVFLDIEMPEYAGFEIVRFFDKIEFEIIFVTAYDQYALRAFELCAVDYLLKPVEVPRLQAAVERARQRIDLQQQAQRLALLDQAMRSRQLNNLTIIEKGYQYIVPFDQIIAFEAQEAYCLIHTTERRYTASRNLKHFETMLEDQTDFIRVHKSWLINKAHIVAYSKTELNIELRGGIQTKLSKYKKGEFEALVKL